MISSLYVGLGSDLELLFVLDIGILHILPLTTNN